MINIRAACSGAARPKSPSARTANPPEKLNVARADLVIYVDPTLGLNASGRRKKNMKVKVLFSASLLAITALASLPAKPLAPSISGDYLEVRSCDVYTGHCFANSEMGISGKEGLLVWSVREGSWKGTPLNGLSVIAAVHTDGTLGDLHYQPRSGKAVLIVDAKANAKQKEALTDLARTMAGKLIKEVVHVKTSSMEVALGTCSKEGCASVKAGKLVEISTRCLGNKDHVCGNEETYYPPLTDVQQALPVVTEFAAFRGAGLNLTWQAAETRSAFIGMFSR
jgi:hypothetical protein